MRITRRRTLIYLSAIVSQNRLNPIVQRAKIDRLVRRALPGYDNVFFSGTKRPITLKLCVQHRVLDYYQIYSNDDPGLTLTYFTAMSNLIPYAFVLEKS